MISGTKFCANHKGGSAGRPERSSMKNIDRLRNMTTRELAKFLINCSAETPLDFCQGCEEYKGEENDCKGCAYNDDLKAWQQWLEREVTC